jgi:tripartite-type tricarboxylate transporter receptor subunit TctC
LVRVFAVTTPKRSAVAPDLPTVAETGVPNYALTAWVGIFAPAGTPPEMVARMNTAINAALAFPDVKERLIKIGGEPLPGPPEQLGQLLREDFAKYGKVIREAGIKAE